MAWLSDLVRVLAEVTDIPEPTVAQIARHVREEGFISSGGRGRSAARMNASDCANLLIAVMVTDQAKNAPIYVSAASHIFRHAQRRKVNKEILEVSWIEQSASGNAVSFREDLTTVISDISTGSLTPVQGEKFRITVEASRPLFRAMIDVFSVDASGKLKTLIDRSYFPAIIPQPPQGDAGGEGYKFPSLRIDAYVDEGIILPLAELVKS